MLPLIAGLPVRLTDTISRTLRLHKQRQGIIIGWHLHPEEDSVMRDGMKLLRKMPTCICVQFPGCTWQVHSALAPGVYPLKPMQRTWIVNKEHGSKISRLGFPLLPHFACTCHMVQGQTLKAMLLNSLNFRASVNVEAMLQAYVGLSRVKLASHLLLMQSFSPKLFQQGAPPGPDLLMQVSRREKDTGSSPAGACPTRSRAESPHQEHAIGR